MLSEYLYIMAAASVALAATPQGFEPAAETSLLVSFGTVAVMDGNVLAKAATQTAPSIGTLSQMEGTSFAVMMIDLDIPTDSPPETNTLLHWMQTGLTQSTTATTMNTTTGAMNAFMFETSDQEAFAEYLGPAPPARVPLSHRYTQILVDTSEATEENLAVLQSAAATIMGFDTMAVLTEAGLAEKVVAGNFMNVTNPGPVASTNTSTGAGGSSGGSAGNGSVTSPTPSPSQTAIFPGAAAAERTSGMVLGMALVGALFFCL